MRARPDSEHETILNRVVIYVLINVYAATIDYLGLVPDQPLLPVIGPYSLIFAMLTVASFLHLLWQPGECPTRKIAMMALDTVCVTYAIHLGGETFLWLYPVLLWIILGNGFRFGNKYLWISSGMTVSAFLALIMLSPFWHRYPALSWGCLVALIILPAYVSVLIRKLNAARQQAEAANRAKSAFLASISHELRTPLTAIIGLSDLLTRTKLSREQADMTETIGESGRSLLSLINAILDLSRLEVGRMPRTAQTVDLFKLSHKVMAMVEVPARKKGVRVALHFGPDVPRFITTYPKHIEDSLVNLASNAVKFTAQGQVLIIANVVTGAGERAFLRVEVRDTGIGVAKDVQGRIFERFTQADETIIDTFGGTGLGLATVKQMIEDIGGSVGVESELGQGSTFWFEIELNVAESASADDWKATPVVLVSTDPVLAGLLDQLGVRAAVTDCMETALAAVDQAAQQHECAPVVIADIRSCGSDFELVAEQLRAATPIGAPKLVAVIDAEGYDPALLPAAHVVTALRRPLDRAAVERALVLSCGVRSPGDGASSSPSQRREGASYRVLVADDNKVNRTVLSKILSQAGHHVLLAENGQIAFELMQNGDIDVALFDLNMPVLSGLEAAQLYNFAAASEARRIPIAALTADATPEAERRCRDAGMVACLTKPIEAPVLLSAIDEIVNAHGLSSATAGASAAAAERNSPVENTASESKEEPIDAQALQDLFDLGGASFVQEVIEHFVTETQEIVEKLEVAVEQQDYKAFREELHALRSGAANVGARRVFEFCLAWREISPQDVVAKGDDVLKTLCDAVLECSDLLGAHSRKLTLGSLPIPSNAPGRGANAQEGAEDLRPPQRKAS